MKLASWGQSWLASSGSPARDRAGGALFVSSHGFRTFCDYPVPEGTRNLYPFSGPKLNYPAHPSPHLGPGFPHSASLLNCEPGLSQD